MNGIDEVKQALVKRALGYDAEETVEEYASEGEDVKLVRKKITKKNVPPDVSAAKLLLEMEGTEDLAAMSDEQLETEKKRLLKIITEKGKNDDEKDGISDSVRRKGVRKSRVDKH